MIYTNTGAKENKVTRRRATKLHLKGWAVPFFCLKNCFHLLYTCTDCIHLPITISHAYRINLNNRREAVVRFWFACLGVPNCLVLFQTVDQDLVFMGSLNTFDQLFAWAQDKCVPLVREITFENAEVSVRPLVKRENISIIQRIFT